MTAPTPDLPFVMRARQSGKVSEVIAAGNAEICRLTDALAAVTAERDQARQMLADAPHERGCGMTRLPGYLHSGECFCWKAGL